uniref:Uncharacterized protein n=1 Tax=Ignisphaera aggregans TaxID=334771 RepID=A0A832AAT9_9CREN
MPKVSTAYGEIYVIVNPTTLYKFVDPSKPTIYSINTELSDGELLVNASVCDRESGLYGVYLVYSLNGLEWSYQPMHISIRYIVEPIGGYGFGEKPFPYTTKIKIPEEAREIEFYVLAIDNIGNHEATRVYAYSIHR